MNDNIYTLGDKISNIEISLDKKVMIKQCLGSRIHSVIDKGEGRIWECVS